MKAEIQMFQIASNVLVELFHDAQLDLNESKVKVRNESQVKLQSMNVLKFPEVPLQSKYCISGLTVNLAFLHLR